MLVVSKEEAKEIRRIKPDIKIIRTMITESKRGTYYCPEYREVIEWLKNERGVDTID